MTFIDSTLVLSQHRLFHAYRVLEEAQRTFNNENPPYNKLKKARHSATHYNNENLAAAITANTTDPERVEVFRELQAARMVRRKADQERLAERQAEIEEEINLKRSEAEGTMSECGCCFGDYPLNRMVHCDGDTLHWFCRACARQTAETEIGNSKYELHCMSMDGCDAGFSAEQR
jgi:TRIAD3 protein (E3 ubiquitin-protein ligase RNF216)